MCPSLALFRLLVGLLCRCFVGRFVFVLRRVVALLLRRCWFVCKAACRLASSVLECVGVIFLRSLFVFVTLGSLRAFLPMLVRSFVRSLLRSSAHPATESQSVCLVCDRVLAWSVCPTGMAFLCVRQLALCVFVHFKLQARSKKSCAGTVWPSFSVIGVIAYFMAKAHEHVACRSCPEKKSP